LVTGGLGIGRNGTEQEGQPDRSTLLGWPDIDPTGITAPRSRMHSLGLALVLVVAAIHAYILVLEMFLWRTERGRRAFGTDQAFADQSATLAANQGLYNGFLAAGLVWGALAADPVGFQVRVFFLGCVIVAGVYGALTVSRRILLVQAAPAIVALAVVLLAG
jgi:putative membrane protein